MQTVHTVWLVLPCTSQGTVIGSEAKQRAASEVHLNLGTMSLDIFTWKKNPNQKSKTKNNPAALPSALTLYGSFLTIKDKTQKLLI